MDWPEAVKVGLAAAPFVGAGVWGLIEARGRRVFASKKLEEEHKATRTLANGNEDRIALLEQGHAHQAELIQESVVKPLGRIEEQLGALNATQIVVARLEEGQKALGRSLDDLRDRVERVER